MGQKVYFGTAGAAVYIVDPKTGEYRESTSQDANLTDANLTDAIVDGVIGYKP